MGDWPTIYDGWTDTQILLGQLLEAQVEEPVLPRVDPAKPTGKGKLVDVSEAAANFMAFEQMVSSNA